MSRFDDAAVERLRALLARRPAIEIAEPDLRRAAVLIPVVRNGEQWAILFERRSEALAAHSGQVAFPGGAVEPEESLDAAAVREAEEEVGIRGEAVEVIGRLDDIVTNSGFLVAPFVGVVREKIEYVPRREEVEEVFEVPVEALLDVSQPEVRFIAFRERQYPAYFYRHEGREIWGLTGRMLKSFLDLVWLAV